MGEVTAEGRDEDPQSRPGRRSSGRRSCRARGRRRPRETAPTASALGDVAGSATLPAAFSILERVADRDEEIEARRRGRRVTCRSQSERFCVAPESVRVAKRLGRRQGGALLVLDADGCDGRAACVVDEIEVEVLPRSRPGIPLQIGADVLAGVEHVASCPRQHRKSCGSCCRPGPIIRCRSSARRRRSRPHRPKDARRRWPPPRLRPAFQPRRCRRRAKELNQATE